MGDIPKLAVGEVMSSSLYIGNTLLGEVSIHFQYEDIALLYGIKKKISISHYSTPSKKYAPLAVLHSIASSGVCLKMKPSGQQSPSLNSVHSECLREAKTAVVLLGENELHLVPMYSREWQKQLPCFWGFSVVSGSYSSCIQMLDMERFAIVFELDETVLVAHTMRNFEERIEALEYQMMVEDYPEDDSQMMVEDYPEDDSQRLKELSAMIKRYEEDKNILTQYIESDQVDDNGKLINSEFEIAPPLSDDQAPVMRPIIRLRERNVILTRIDPENPDTSVLVRVHPGWEDLRKFLIRLEVYICTMSERDHALEMWRLLDPEATLISNSELLHRFVCFKPGILKSLNNIVFHSGICHPKIALIIDKGLEVWQNRDQSRVHVVPAFVPYDVPRIEEARRSSILDLTRYAASIAGPAYFKDFGTKFCHVMDKVLYEASVTDIPSAPDVSHYLPREVGPLGKECGQQLEYRCEPTGYEDY